MAVTLTFLGHSGFLFDDGSGKLCVDPFLTGNPLATLTPDKIQTDYLAFTHGHADHFSEAMAVLKANPEATVIAPFEVCEWLGEQGVEKLEPGNPGGRIVTDFGSVDFTQAIHSSSMNGRYLGAACGLMIRIGGKTIYHCGDTALFSDMKLIGEIGQPDIAMIPVGDRFTMGPELATYAAEWVRPRTVIPIHYKTFDVLNQTIEGFEPKGVQVKEMQPGETWVYPG